MSRCMLGAMLSMLFFVTLEARREYCIAAVVGAQEDAALACATFERRQTEIDTAKHEQLAARRRPGDPANRARRIEAVPTSRCLRSGMPTDGNSDEVVRRLREVSAWRIAREARWRTFAAWCAVVTLGAGISLAALDARRAPVTDPPAARTDLPAARPFAPARLIEHRHEMGTPPTPPPTAVIKAQNGDHLGEA